MADIVKPLVAYVANYDWRMEKSLRDIVRENVERIKKSRELSEQRIADRRGPSQRTVNRALTGQNLTLESVERLAQALGLEPWHLCVPNMDLAQLASRDAAEEMDSKPGRGAVKLWRKYRQAEPHVREAIDALLRKNELQVVSEDEKGRVRPTPT